MKKTTKIIIVLLIVIIAGITVVTSMKHAADGPSEVSAEKAAMASERLWIKVSLSGLLRKNGPIRI